MDAQPRGYCAGCSYPLQGLAARDGVYRCPECGRPFDPAKPRTFHINPHGRIRRWLASPLGWSLPALMLLAAAVVIGSAGYPLRTMRPGLVDWLLYFQWQNLRDRTALLTPRDWCYTLAMLAAGLLTLVWLLRVAFRLPARRGSDDPPAELRVNIGRRHALVAIGLFLTTAGTMLGWPFRLAQHWIAQRRLGSRARFPAWAPRPAPVVLTDDQTLATLRAAVMDMPSAEDRMVGVQLLVEDHVGIAVNVLRQAVAVERDSAVRTVELHLLGIARDADSLPLLTGFLDHPDAATRAAAIDAIGLLRSPAYQVGMGNTWGTAPTTTGQPPVDLAGLIAVNEESPRRWPARLSLATRPIKAPLRGWLQEFMCSAVTSDEREAAARALVNWPADRYRLRVAEWGVWVSDGGELKLAQSIIDEIPDFVHRTGNQLSEFAGRVNQMMEVSKPIIHVTVDQPMAIDIGAMIRRGRPWFAYPRPDDFEVTAETFYDRRAWNQPSTRPTSQPAPVLQPLDRSDLSGLTDLRQGYPWISPSSPTVGPTAAGGFAPSRNEITSLGLRWQSIIASPHKLSWMLPPAVDPDPKFAWWSRLREVPSAWVSSRGEAERFLYYDGPTLTPSPVGAKLEGNELQLIWQKGRFDAEAFWDYDPKESGRALKSGGMLLIRVREGRVSGQTITPPVLWDKIHLSCLSVKLGEDPLDATQVVQTLRQQLTTAGLTVPEADGLIDAWRPQFFHTEGARLLFLLSREDYDQLCPITVRPTPTEMARVGIILTEFS